MGGAFGYKAKVHNVDVGGCLQNMLSLGLCKVIREKLPRRRRVDWGLSKIEKCEAPVGNVGGYASCHEDASVIWILLCAPSNPEERRFERKGAGRRSKCARHAAGLIHVGILQSPSLDDFGSLDVPDDNARVIMTGEEKGPSGMPCYLNKSRGASGFGSRRVRVSSRRSGWEAELEVIDGLVLFERVQNCSFRVADQEGSNVPRVHGKRHDWHQLCSGVPFAPEIGDFQGCQTLSVKIVRDDFASNRKILRTMPSESKER